MSTRKGTLAHMCDTSRPLRGGTPVRIIASNARSHTCADHRVQCAVAHLCGSLRPMRGRTPVRILASSARPHTCADHRVQCAVAHLCGSLRPMRGRTPVRIIASNARSHTCADHCVQCAVAHLCGSLRPVRGRTPVRIVASNARSSTCTIHRSHTNADYARVIRSSMVKQQSSTRRGSENVITLAVRITSQHYMLCTCFQFELPVGLRKKEIILGMTNDVRLALWIGPDPGSWPGGAASVKEVGA